MRVWWVGGGSLRTLGCRGLACQLGPGLPLLGVRAKPEVKTLDLWGHLGRTPAWSPNTCAELHPHGRDGSLPPSLSLDARPLQELLIVTHTHLAISLPTPPTLPRSCN